MEWESYTHVEDGDYEGYEAYLESLEEQFYEDGELAKMADYYKTEWQADAEFING